MLTTHLCGCLLVLGASLSFRSVSAQNSVDWLHQTGDGKVYINLPRDENWSEYFPLKTIWKKMRIVDDGSLKEGSRQVTIDMKDYAYASHNGGISNNHKLKEMDWGIAADCRAGGERYQSSYSLSLKGTPFSLQASEPKFPKAGWLAHGGATCSQNQQVCTGKCGGYCGYCGFEHAGVLKTVRLVVSDQKMFDAAFITTTVTRTTTTTITTVTVTTTTATTTSRTTTSVTTTTPATCGPGEMRNERSNTCKNCPPGTFRPDPAHSATKCIPHSKCSNNEHVLVDATPTANVHCKTTAASCSKDEWESKAPVDGSEDRECTPITQCLDGEYVKVAATKNADQLCDTCGDGSKASYNGGCTSTSTTTTTTSRTTTSKTRTTKTTTSATSTSTTATSTTASTTTTTMTTTTLYGNAAVANIKDDGVSISIADIQEGLGKEFLDIPDELQVVDLYQEGFTLAEIVAAGYSRSDVQRAGFSAGEYESAKEEADTASAAAAASSGAAGQKTKAAATTTTVIVAAIVCLVVIAVAAVIVAKKSNGEGSHNDPPPSSFENPMYDSFANAEKGNPAYSDTPSGGAVAGYMDVNPADHGGTSSSASSGYMDVGGTNAIGGEGSEEEEDV